MLFYVRYPQPGVFPGRWDTTFEGPFATREAAEAHAQPRYPGLLWSIIEVEHEHEIYERPWQPYEGERPRLGDTEDTFDRHLQNPLQYRASHGGSSPGARDQRPPLEAGHWWEATYDLGDRHISVVFEADYRARAIHYRYVRPDPIQALQQAKMAADLNLSLPLAESTPLQATATRTLPEGELVVLSTCAYLLEADRWTLATGDAERLLSFKHLREY